MKGFGEGGYVQESSAGEVSPVPEVACSHHVLRVVHLLGQFWDGDRAEGVCSTGGERSESDHKEVKTWERNHIHGQLPQVRVQLTRETKAGGDTGHDSGNKVVQVTVGWGGELKSPHADVVQGLIVDTKGLVRVLNCRTS